MTSLATPVRVDDAIVGVAGVDVPLATISEQVGAIHPYDVGSAALVSSAGLVVASNRSGDEAARKEVRGMLAKADKGDKDAAWKVGQLMRAAPEIADRTACDIASAVESKMIRRAFGEDALGTAEAVRL